MEYEVRFVQNANLYQLEAKKKLIRITTAPMALAYPLSAQPSFMNDNGLDVIMMSSDGPELPQLLANETCPHIIVPLTRSMTPVRDLYVLFILIKTFIKLKPDIVHTETPKAGLIGMLAAWVCSVKLRIHTVAGLPLMVEKGFKLKLLKLIEKITYRAATNVWPNSLSLKNFIVANKLAPKNKLNIIGNGSSNGINLKRFTREKLNAEKLEKIKRSNNYDRNNIYLLFVGRLVRDKGIIELVDVFCELQKKNPFLRLILVGRYEEKLDPLPSAIQAEISRNTAIIQIDWTDDVEYYMALSDYFVFPSYREGFPNVLLEAGAMGLPVICSKIPGNVDIISNNETGFIFESQNKTALNSTLVEALKEKENSQKMAIHLKKIITNKYDRETFWQHMLNEYKLLLKKIS